jgi:hypothetical protein
MYSRFQTLTESYDNNHCTFILSSKTIFDLSLCTFISFILPILQYVYKMFDFFLRSFVNTWKIIMCMYSRFTNIVSLF